MKSVAVAQGFEFSGIHAGVKVMRKDLALIVSQTRCNAAGVFTQNRCRAHCVERTASLLPRDDTRAIVINAGNANCLNGPSGKQSDHEMALAVASALDLDGNQVLTASTGSIGKPLPIERIQKAVPALIQSLRSTVDTAAEAILTTDKSVKVASRVVETGGGTVTLTAIAKGSGMIHPNMATMLAFVCTDAHIETDVLRAFLADATEESFNQISVDRDTSTNDMFLVLANGVSGVTVEAGDDRFGAAMRSLCRELARAMAADGEGATRLVSVKVSGATDVETARALARAAVSSNLFKCSLFGDNSGWGRCLAAVGASAGERGLRIDVERVTLLVNGVAEFAQGRPTGERAGLTGPEVRIDVALGQGDASARAWGCDMSYDYVSINAVTKSEPLETHSPGLKRRLLVEALSYIRRFAGRIAVIKYGGAAMVRDDLKDAFAEDLVLLKAAGLMPVVVHGGGPEISQTLERLGEPTRFVNGIRVTRASSMKVVEMVLTGSVNTDVVTRIQKFGGSAIGVSGKDGSLLSARKLTIDGADLGMVGEVEEVRTEIIHMLLENGYIPVISPIGVDEHGNTYNVNADQVAAQVAAALEAEKILFLTDVPGILEDGKLLSRLKPAQVNGLIERGVVSGGMVPKVQALLASLSAGVKSAHIIDGRVPHNLLAELFTENGVGTWVLTENGAPLRPGR